MDIRVGTEADLRAARDLVDVGGDEGATVVMVVAEDGGEVVGAAAGELGVGVVHLAGVGVRVEARRRGIGTALVEALADQAYLSGARRLTALAPDAAARGFCDALGLRPTGQVELAGGAVADAYEAELDAPATELVVREGGLRLGQLLKLAGLAGTGSDARELLAAGEVEVNGEVDQRRGRQIADGDVVAVRERSVRVVMPR